MDWRKWGKRAWDIASTIDTLWSWASRFGPIGALGGLVLGIVGASPMSTAFVVVFAFSLLSLVASYMSDRAHKAKVAKYEEMVERLYKLHFEHILTQGDVIGELRARADAQEKEIKKLNAYIEVIVQRLSTSPRLGPTPTLNPQDIDNDNP